MVSIALAYAKRISAQNPHLFQRDVDKIVTTILDQIAKALRRGDKSGYGVSERFRPRFAERARGAIPGRALKCRSHKKSFRSSRQEKKCARGLMGKLLSLPNQNPANANSPLVEPFNSHSLYRQDRP